MWSAQQNLDWSWRHSWVSSTERKNCVAHNVLANESCFLLLFRGFLVVGLLGSNIPCKLLILSSVSFKTESDFQLWTLPWVFLSLYCWDFVVPWATVYLIPPHILIIWTGSIDTSEISLQVRIKRIDGFSLSFLDTSCVSLLPFFSLCFCFHLLLALVP